ncbi:unnamed protein product, partial [Didymodactylos carnosus]
MSFLRAVGTEQEQDSSCPQQHYHRTVPLQEICRQITDFSQKTDGTLTLMNLMYIEKQVCQKYQLEQFSQLNYGDFNHFLYKYRSDIGTNLEFYLYKSDCGIKRIELFRFVNKFLYRSSTDDQEKLRLIEKVVLNKFKLQNLGQIGFANMKQLYEKTLQFEEKSTMNIIQYEEALLQNEYLQTLDVSIRGPSMNSDQLCSYLIQCPILQDLNSWTHWNHLFLKEHGSLKDFLCKYSYILQKDLICLELTDGQMIRLYSSSDLSKFEQELQLENLKQAACHLISFFYRSDGQYLLKNKIITWLLEQRSLVNMNKCEPLRPFQLVLEFLCYLPCLFSQTIIKTLILETLEYVFEEKYGNSKVILWQLTENNLQRRLYLEEIGLTLGIVEWTKMLNDNIQKSIDKTANSDQEITTITNIEETSVFSLNNSNDKDFNEQEISELKEEFLIEKTDSLLNDVSVAESGVAMSDDHNQTSLVVDVNNAQQSRRDLAYCHIDDIRCIRFGENSGLDGTGRLLVENLQGIIERSLEKLANDLYSEQTHFVLELLQNADDNQYNEKTIPKVKFIITKETILLCNNESGFTRENIDALCNVGRSTKGKHKAGYSGHKGIGFKSVFNVSLCPEIHSNGYHICFDANQGQIGYVKPTWMFTYDLSCESDSNWATYIKLNLKPEVQDNLKRKFQDIQSPLLLFLHRLQQIEIVHEDHSKVFTRKDHSNDIIELCELDSNAEPIRHYWLVIKKKLDIPQELQVY